MIVMGIIFIMISLVILLLFVNANGVDCLISVDAETQRYNELDLKFEENVAKLVSENTDEQQVRSALQNDDIWKQRQESELCLSLWGETPINMDSPSTDVSFWENNIFIVVAGAITGAVIGIFGTERIRQYYLRQRGKESIKIELLRMQNMFKKERLEFRYKSVALNYVNQEFSTIIFDGVISSGIFVYFSIRLQILLNSLYFQVKHHNKIIEKIEEFHDKIRKQSLSTDNHTVMIEHMGELTVADNNILDLIKKVEDELEK